MRHREVIAHIARRLPHQTQREVEEVIDLLIELLQDKLALGESFSLPDVGMLSIEMQEMFAGGAVARHSKQKTLTRIYGRFRPAGALKDRVIKESRR